jgi:hypothetical protein
MATSDIIRSRALAPEERILSENSNRLPYSLYFCEVKKNLVKLHSELVVT